MFSRNLSIRSTAAYCLLVIRLFAAPPVLDVDYCRTVGKSHHFNSTVDTHTVSSLRSGKRSPGRRPDLAQTIHDETSEDPPCRSIDLIIGVDLFLATLLLLHEQFPQHSKPSEFTSALRLCRRAEDNSLTYVIQVNNL